MILSPLKDLSKVQHVDIRQKQLDCISHVNILTKSVALCLFYLWMRCFGIGMDILLIVFHSGSSFQWTESPFRLVCCIGGDSVSHSNTEVHIHV